MAPEVRVRWTWSLRKVELFVKGEATVTAVEIKPPFPSPLALVDDAFRYAIWVERKFPHLKDQITIDDHHLKQSYYAARKQYEIANRPPTPYTSPPTPRHICELREGTEQKGEFRLSGIPDVVGALEAWKSWRWEEETQRLFSPSQRFIWEPLCIAEAKCSTCPAPPCTRCTCGIYAGTEAQASSYGQVLGMLKQWGRFVQGSSGVKSQFAYPSWFLLRPEQIEMLEGLKQYGVPIKILQPMVLWDPKEDGFTVGGDVDEYWRNEENRSGGAGDGSDPNQDPREDY